MNTDPDSMKALVAMFQTLPREEEAPDEVRRRVRIVTEEGRTVFAFLRAGRGPLGFTGWDATHDVAESCEVREPELEHFVLAVEKPGAPLHLLSQRGIVGVVRSVAAEDRPAG
jgi:hypothetical protein